MQTKMWTRDARNGGAVWLVLLAVLGTLPLAAGEKTGGKLDQLDRVELREQILWFGPGESNPIFVPEALLAETPLESAPVGDIERDLLRSLVEKFQHPRWGNRCLPYRDCSTMQGSADELMSLEEMLREQEIVFVGEVVEIVPGWSTWTGHVARMAYVEVQEVLRGATHEPGVRPGKVVGLHFKGGTTRVAGTELCEDIRPDFYQPVLGDRVVVGGKVLGSDEDFFLRRVLFPVLGGEVLVQPYGQLAGTEIARDLRDLKHDLKADREHR